MVPILTWEDIAQLYKENKTEECLESVLFFLLVNNHHNEALLLKAKCQFKLAQETSRNKKRYLLRNKIAYKSFKTVLISQPSNEEALLMIAYIGIFILKFRLHLAIIYCRKLRNSHCPETRLKSIDYEIEAHLLVGDSFHALLSLDTLIKINKVTHENDRSKLDSAMNKCFFKKGDIYMARNHDILKALAAYKEGFKYINEDQDIHLDIAKLGFENNETDFGIQVSLHILKRGYTGNKEQLSDLYLQLKQLNEENSDNRMLFTCLVYAIRELHLKTSDLNYMIEIFSLCKNYISVYPDWHEPYHFVGTLFFEAENYRLALPYLAKSVERNGCALTQFQYIASFFYIKNRFPKFIPRPADSPAEYLHAGIQLTKLEQELKTDTLKIQVWEFQELFFEIAYQGFSDYFNNGIGKSQTNSPSKFALCCNKYGILMANLKKYDKASQIHLLGYSISQLQEQLGNFGKALYETGRYQDAIETLSKVIKSNASELNFKQSLDLKVYSLKARLELGQTERIKEFFKEIDDDYDRYIADKGYESRKKIFSEIYTSIQELRKTIFNTANLEETIKIWLAQLLKYPDDGYSSRILMSLYYQKADYGNCIACADNYQMTNPDTRSPYEDSQLHYMRGLSHLRLAEYPQAYRNLKWLAHLLNNRYKSNEYIKYKNYINLTTCAFKMRKWEECKNYCSLAMFYYYKNQWQMDFEFEQMAQYYTDAALALLEENDPVENIDQILRLPYEGTKPLKRKKK